MKETKHQNPIILALAIIGVLAILYGAWTLYQQHAAEEYQRWFFSAPPPSGVPNPLQTNSAPPPQP
jgi:hypothetical protein